MQSGNCCSDLLVKSFCNCGLNKKIPVKKKYWSNTHKSLSNVINYNKNANNRIVSHNQFSIVFIKPIAKKTRSALNVGQWNDNPIAQNELIQTLVINGQANNKKGLNFNSSKLMVRSFSPKLLITVS